MPLTTRSGTVSGCAETGHVFRIEAQSYNPFIINDLEYDISLRIVITVI